MLLCTSTIVLLELLYDTRSAALTALTATEGGRQTNFLNGELLTFCKVIFIMLSNSIPLSTTDCVPAVHPSVCWIFRSVATQRFNGRHISVIYNWFKLSQDLQRFSTLLRPSIPYTVPLTPIGSLRDLFPVFLPTNNSRILLFNISVHLRHVITMFVREYVRTLHVLFSSSPLSASVAVIVDAR
jgi:hypothetical protein